jgi:hypothetical protein
MALGSISHPTVVKPYVGPRPFEASQAHLFFGREYEASDLLSLVIAERLVLFYAQSGSGKSSLVNTRLLPGLRRRGFSVLPVSRLSGQIEITGDGNVFVQNLLLSLERTRNRKTIPRSLRLSQYLAHLTPEDLVALDAGSGIEPPVASDAPIEPLALVIDQFEEIFTAYPAAWNQRSGFFEQLN